MSITSVGGQSPSTGLSNVSHSDERRWITVYPIYLNRDKTKPEGRRVAKEQAVHRPSLADIYEACIALNLPATAQRDKRYSRDALVQVGRAKVQIKDAQGKPLRADIHSKDDLLRHLCTTINSNTGRSARVQQEEKDEAKFNSIYLPAGTHVDKVARREQQIKEREKAKEAKIKDAKKGRRR